MVVADAAGLISAGLLAYSIWAGPLLGQRLSLYAELWPLLPLFLAGYAQAGLYSVTGLGPVETMRRLTYVTTITFLLVAAISFGLKLPHVYSRVTFSIAFLLALFLVPTFRLSMLAIVSRTRWWPVPAVLAVDDLQRARRILDELEWNRNLGYAPAAVLWLGAGDPPASDGLPPISPVSHSAEVARGVDIVLLAAGGPTSADRFDELHQFFRRVLVVRELDELPVEGIRIRNLGSLLGIEYTNNLLDPPNRIVKRTVDLVLGSLLFLLALPLLVLALLAVQLRSPGPAFYVQERTGLGGRRIRVPKIRTMVPGAEAQLEAATARDPELARQWRERMKLENDPRLVPGVGRFLRRWSLDELPQLWSVVRGEMSLVGPRPFPDYHLAQFPGTFLELRQRVRPGITGLWQVNVRSDGPLERQQVFDTYYIRNWSVWLDLYILARTIGAVLKGKGAY
jgi:Undecaprenyl-phosphate galactose phosphotransferase WbaP